MQINHYVVHELKKERHGIATVKPSQKLPAISDQAERLLTALNEKYKEKEIYGKFSDVKEHSFPWHFEAYSKSKSNKTAFLKFSVSVMNLLATQLSNVGLATGGYFVFADYQISNDNFLAIFLVRNHDGFLFKEETGENEIELEYIDVKDQLHIAVDKLAMACRINNNNFIKRNEQAKNYLSFLRKGSLDASDYFILWISAIELRKNSEYTDALCDVIRGIDLPDELDGAAVDRDILKKAVYEYSVSQPNNKVDLIELSKKIYGDDKPTKIIDYAQSLNLDISTEFTPDKQKLRKLYKVSISQDDITLKFDYKSWQDKKVAISGNKVIIDSHELVKKIQKEIELPDSV